MRGASPPQQGPRPGLIERKVVQIVSIRRRYTILAAVLGTVAVVLPAVAGSETTPTITAHTEGSYGSYSSHSWMPSTATIGAGGTVSFSNPYTEEHHGLKFTGGPAVPSCSGLPAAAETAAGAPNWHAECTFATPGTYSFICTVHPSEMQGTITVNPNGTTTTTTTTPTTTTTTTPAAPGGSPGGSSSGSPIRGLALRASQRGGSVKGSFEVSSAGAGERLEIDLLARRASLARVRHSAPVRVGRLVRGAVAAGRLSFAVKLDALALRTLRRRLRLPLTVRITLAPVHGAAATVTRSVVEHA